MEKLYSPATIRKLKEKHDFRFSKSLGQNFLTDPEVCPAMARAACDENTGVLEIGPGFGVLTAELSKAAKRVVAIELDERLKKVLPETLADCKNVEVIYGDALKLDLKALIKEHFADCERVAVCANLPYNITTPVLTKLLESRRFSAITVMIQREVARRICAAPGTSDYGAFSVFCQYHAQCELLFDVGPECFLPAPKVTSSVLRMIPLEQPPVAVEDEAAFFALVRAAFAQRRKTLLNGLCSAYGSRFSKEELRAILSANGLPEDIRGERLGLAQFAALAKCLK